MCVPGMCLNPPTRAGSETTPYATCPCARLLPTQHILRKRAPNKPPAGSFEFLCAKAVLCCVLWPPLSAAPANAGGWSLPTGSGYGKYKSYSVNPDIPTLHK